MYTFPAFLQGCLFATALVLPVLAKAQIPENIDITQPGEQEGYWGEPLYLVALAIIVIFIILFFAWSRRTREKKRQ